MSNINDKIEIEEQTEFSIPDDARRVDALMDQINQSIIGDQGLMCEGAVMYIATALVHSTGDVERNVKGIHELLDKYVTALKTEHAGCIAALVASGDQGTHHVH